MDIWKVLGINPTKDEKEIKTAYRSKLQSVHPEENPKGFMELRKAYEEAVRLSKEEDTQEETEELTGVLAKIDRLYHDFETRIDVSAWEDLFNEDEFVALDSSEDSFFILVRYLMEHFYLPSEVWKLIVDTFEIAERKKELKEKLPEEFIDYMINNGIHKDIIDYKLFTGNYAEVDTYLLNYYKLDIATRKGLHEEQLSLIETLESLAVSHPYLIISKNRMKIHDMNEDLEEENLEKAEDEAEEIKREFDRKTAYAEKYQEELQDILEETENVLEDYPEDVALLHACGDIALLMLDIDLATSYYDKAKEIDPENYLVKGKQAELCFVKKEYAKSRDIYLDLLKLNHYDNNVRVGMIRANIGLIATLKQKIKENPEDVKPYIEMGWSYYQSYHFAEAIEILSKVSPSEEQTCEYHNVLGRCYLCTAQYDEALKHFKIWLDAVKALDPEDETKEVQDKIKRYHYIHFLIADCFLKQKQYEEAEKYLTIAMEKEHDEIVLSYEANCELQYLRKEYEKCLDACDQLLAKDARNYIAYDFMARSYYELQYFKESLTACEHAIGLYPYVATPYSVEIKIYLRVGQIDSAKAILQRYQSFGVESDCIDYAHALIMDAEKASDEDIIKLLSKTVERRNGELSDMDEYDKIYLRLAEAYASMEKYKEAMEFYRKAVEENPEHPVAYGRMGVIEKIFNRNEEAIALFDKQLSMHPHPFYYMQRGEAYRALLKHKEALSDYDKALSMDSNYDECRLERARLYDLMGRFKEALSESEALEKKNGLDTKTGLVVLILKARVLQCLNRFEESKACYEAILESKQLLMPIACNYAELLYRMGQVKQACTMLEHQIEAETSGNLDYLRGGYLLLAEMYAYEGDIDHAKALFDKLKSIDDKLKAASYGEMARILVMCGDYEGAKEYCETAIRLDNNKQSIYHIRLAEILAKRHRFSMASVKKTLSNCKFSVPAKSTEKGMPADIYISKSQFYRLQKMGKDALDVIALVKTARRKPGYLYSEIHEALYEKALVCESMKDFEGSRQALKEALKICGHHAIYEKELKRIEKL